MSGPREAQLYCQKPQILYHLLRLQGPCFGAHTKSYAPHKHALATRRVFIATVHWNSDDWVELQVSRLRRFIPLECQLYAFVDGVSDSLISHFDQTFCDDALSHAQKLDFLGERISEDAEPEDILLFIDGDAFPIASLDTVIHDLDRYPLIAVRRDENFGDKQPHPCFCLTTVGFWKAVKGTWKPGVQWMRDDGVMGSDVGGNLYGILRDNGIEWKPLLRSNLVDLHPLFFGVYGDCVYHHGAGFRDKLCRRDSRRGIDTYSAWCIRHINAWQGNALLKRPRTWLRRHVNWYMRLKNGRLHRKVMADIATDENFVFTLQLVAV